MATKLTSNGHIKGFNNILSMLKINGILYISLPIANLAEVQFNAHTIFHPKDIFTLPENEECITLVRFDYVDDAGNLHKNIDISAKNINTQFGCGIYTFKKVNE